MGKSGFSTDAERRVWDETEAEMASAGLPDGLFSYQKFRFGFVLEGLGPENVGIFYGHLDWLTAVLLISWAFGIVSGRLVIFFRFGML
jgi:hypothetical protein